MENNSLVRVLHLWNNYYPGLFDHSHQSCLMNKIPSELACRSLFRISDCLPAHTYFLREYHTKDPGLYSLLNRARRRLHAILDDRRFGKFAAARVAAFGPTVLHLHYGLTAALLVGANALPDLPCIVSFYGVDASASLRDRKIADAYRTIFRRDVTAHVLCESVADRVRKLGCPSSRIKLINLPAGVEDIPPIAFPPAGPTRFLIPARFVEKKGHMVLLEAFSELKRGGSSATLTCWGYGDPTSIEAAVRGFALQKSVRVINNNFEGEFVPSFIRILEDHDVVLAPSISAANGDDEAGPALTVVMAQAAGRPVIVSDFPGAECSVTDGVEGIVVPQRDARALSDAMRRLDAAGDSWRALGSAGRRRVLADFSKATYWRELSDLYRTLSRSVSLPSADTRVDRLT